MKQRTARAVALVIAIVVLVLGGTAPVASAATRSTPAGVTASGTPRGSGTWFGPDLDWANDAPDGYAGRLGATPSMYGIDVDYPVDARAAEQWRTAARQAAAQGAVLVVSFEPRTSLARLDAADARRADGLLEQVRKQYGTEQLVRFAPEMNGTWVRWGQQPTEFVSAFRQLARVVHAGTSKARMVWSPSYGSGYPFGEAAGRLASANAMDIAALDTNHDDRLTEADDPYAPYWPGSGSVDWVGLSMFFFGKGKATAAAGRAVSLSQNAAPVAGEVDRRFDESWGYTQPQDRTFYQRFAVGEHRPLLLDTGALDVHSLGGAAELTVKQGWWRQVIAALPSHPLVRGVTWLEADREEPEAGNRVADWRDTAVRGIAGSFRTDLQDAGRFVFGPVTDRVTAQQGSAATNQQLETGGDQMAWIVACAVVLALTFLLSGLVGRLAPSWRYDDDGKPGRDLRIDLFRGFIILAVVITHVELAGPYSYLTLHAIGAITGAEMFVFLSGLVLGMVYPLGVARFGEWASAVNAWRRARKQYLVTLGVILVVFALSFVPFLKASAITTFTDRGTGTGGVGAEGRVYDLYPNAMRLLDYPPPWYAVRQFLLLEMGPWPFNIMGLFVVLSIAIPVLMWIIRRRAWWALLVVSWALYVLDAVRPDLSPLPSQFEAVFPLFTWQVVFTHGLVLGYYRRRIVAALTSRVGKLLMAIGVVGYAGFLVYVWAGHVAGFTPTPFPAGMYDELYNTAYQRVDLQWGRLVDIAFFAVVSYAVLTVFWKPINAAIGWLWIPLGQASLYVFVWQVFFVLLIASIPGLDPSNVLEGTLIHTAMILLSWYMVRKRFLFAVIPR
ncbi:MULTISPECIES: OpgC domain-containing protein [unclassified Curtobacterium]|uniref:OpgC domain-containing protein n=1 Tax=unclassified Curtobacterium TaxID=257496 RepID=UPI0011B60291|nr:MULTISPECIES: OpgC domain-containing protein [unclassified Curtobacterium]